MAAVTNTTGPPFMTRSSRLPDERARANVLGSTRPRRVPRRVTRIPAKKPAKAAEPKARPTSLGEAPAAVPNRSTYAQMPPWARCATRMAARQNRTGVLETLMGLVAWSGSARCRGYHATRRKPGMVRHRYAVKTPLIPPRSITPGMIRKNSRVAAAILAIVQMPKFRSGQRVPAIEEMTAAVTAPSPMPVTARLTSRTSN